MEILLLTTASAAGGSAGVLPALDLLPHTLRTAPRDVRALMAGTSPDVVIVDARTELAEARATCRMLHATGLGVPMLAVVTESGLVAVNLGGAGEEVGVKYFEHCAAGTGGDHHGFGLVQTLEDRPGDRAGFVPVTGVERRLAATGEFLRAFDLVTEPFENLHHADADAREHQVHEAGDEQSDGHR